MIEFKYGYSSKEVDLESLAGVVIESIDGMGKYSDEIVITTQCGRQFKMFHNQDCCEDVRVVDVCGDIDDLIGHKIVHFEKRTSSGDNFSKDSPSDRCESFTWTFYDIQTTKGCVNIRWLGESNGYYSESVEVVWGKSEKDLIEEISTKAPDWNKYLSN